MRDLLSDPVFAALRARADGAEVANAEARAAADAAREERWRRFLEQRRIRAAEVDARFAAFREWWIADNPPPPPPWQPPGPPF